MTVLGVPRRTLGVCFTKTEIVFAFVEQDGRVVMRGRVPRTPRGREALLDAHPPNVEIVVLSSNATDAADPLIPLARTLGTPCWYVPSELLFALCAVAGIANRAPELSAALLARLPHAPLHALRKELRRAPSGCR